MNILPANTQNKGMLVIFTRAIIIYIFLLIAMRMMGKKQMGELQPFEFAISLIVADLACVPMSDTSIPISYGLIPIFTLFVLHLIVTKIVKHNIRLRRLINGKPVVVITPDGIDYKMLKKLDMTTNDLLEGIRGAGYFSPNEVMYAIVETNGKMTVLPRTENSPVTLGDIKNDVEEATLPITLISEGKMIEANLIVSGIDNTRVERIISHYSLSISDVLLLMIRGDKVYIQSFTTPAIATTLEEIGV